MVPQNRRFLAQPWFARQAADHIGNSPAADSVTIAVVEYDPRVRAALSRLLRSAGFKVEAFNSADRLLATSARFGCIVLDVLLGGMTGIELHALLSGDRCVAPVILITGHDTPAAEEYARNAAIRYLRKPYRARDLLLAVQQAVGLPSDQTTRDEDMAR